MIIHTVIFTWKDGVRREQIEDLRAALDQVASQVQDLLTIQHGPDLRIREGNGDYALIATFADEDGWRNYQAHPSHKAFVRDVVTPLQAHRVAVQITA